MNLTDRIEKKPNNNLLMGSLVIVAAPLVMYGLGEIMNYASQVNFKDGNSICGTLDLGFSYTLKGLASFTCLCGLVNTYRGNYPNQKI